MTDINQTKDKLTISTLTILNGQNLSSSLDLLGTSLVSIITPVTYTGTDIEFHSSLDDIKYYAEKDQTNQPLSYITAADSKYRILVADTIGIKFLKLNSVTPQSQDVDIIVLTRQV